MVKKNNEVIIPQVKIEIKKKNMTSNGSCGVLLNTAMRKWGIKKQLKKVKRVKKRNRGYSDVSYRYSQMCNFMTGGVGLNSLDILEMDKSFREIVGLRDVPDPSSMGEYLRSYEEGDVESLREGCISSTKKIMSSLSERELLYGGWLYCFIDGSLLEIEGSKKEGTEKKDRRE